jgi:hypothetical protein
VGRRYPVGDRFNIQPRNANEISRDAYIADQRPWVSIQARAAGPFKLEGSEWKCPVTLVAINHGKSPALDVDDQPALQVLPPNLGIKDAFKEFREGTFLENQKKPKSGEIVYPGLDLSHPATLPLMHGDELKELINPVLFMFVAYTLPAGMTKSITVHHSAKACFIGVLRQQGERPGPVDLRAGHDQPTALCFFSEVGTSFGD